MPMRANPYIAGNPVGGSGAFIGRADVLRSVLRVLKNPHENAIVLFGQRRIGKTSVLQELEQLLPKEGPYRPLYFDLQDKAALPLSHVLHELAQHLAQGFEVDTLPLGEDLPQRFRNEFIPLVLQQLPTATSLVLLFDEFDVLDNPGENKAGATFFPYLRDLLTLNPRLQFIFVIGRRPEDLSSLTLSIFKGVKAERISLLSAQDTAALVRLAERNGSLQWREDAVSQVYALTGGHPFLTQQLCQEIWEAAYDDDPEAIPEISANTVDSAVSATLNAATNALEWLWNGLKPAERIVAAALAEAGPKTITQEELEARLHASGVRILVGELRNAPTVLQQWDLIEPAGESNQTGYRFRVELLRRWLVERKPLARVQDEIDYVEPLAESIFQVASSLYRQNKLDEAVSDLRRVMALNPNHMRGTLLLAQLLLVRGAVDEAQHLLDGLYVINPAAARPLLTEVLLIRARTAKDAEERLLLYEQVLQLAPDQPEARRGRQQTWLEQVTVLEKAGAYIQAFKMSQGLLAELPADHPQRGRLQAIEPKLKLDSLCQQALAAVQHKEYHVAIPLLLEMISLEPTYCESTRYLHLAVKGEDIEEYKTAAKAVQQAKQVIERDLQREKELHEQCEVELVDARQRLAELEPSAISNLAYRRLSPWNPVHYLKLLQWIFITPYKLKAYQTQSGKIYKSLLQPIGGYLTSILTWLPLLLPTLALGLGRLPLRVDAWPTTTYWWISLSLIGMILLSNWLDSKGVSDTIFGVAIGVAFSVAGIAAFGVVLGLPSINVAGSVIFGVTSILASFIAGLVALCIAFGVVGSIALFFASVVALGVVISVAFVLAIGIASGEGNSVVFGVVFVLLSGISFGVVYGMVGGVGNSITKGVASWLGYSCYGAFILAYVFLIWYCYLGGNQWFA